MGACTNYTTFGSTNNYPVVFTQNNIARATIGATYGNFGIGIYEAAYKLHVIGTASVTNFIMTGASPSTNAILTSIDNIGTAKWSTPVEVLSSLSAATGSGSASYVPYWKSSNNLSATSSIYINTEYVGINKTNPLAHLDVNGLVRFNHNGFTSYTLFQNSNEINTYVSDGNAVGSTPSNLFIQPAQYNNVGGVTRIGKDNLIINSNFTGSSISGLTITTASNVGLGTGLPSAKLHIVASQSNPLIIASGSTNDDLVRITQVGTGRSLVVEDSANPDTSLFFVDTTGNVGIGLTQTTYKLDVNGTQRIWGQGLTGSTLFTVQGTSGELFTIVDSLTGSLFSVNDISGLPIIETFSDSTTLIGSYLAPSLYTTKKVNLTAGVTTSIYSIATASYNSAYFDYNAINASNARAGSIMAIWNTAGVEFTETTTNDIGNTSGLTFSFALVNGLANLRAFASSAGWTIKTIIRSI